MTEEPREEGMTKKVVSRRDFLKYAGLAGGTIAAAGGLGGLLAACGETTETTTTGATTATTGGAVTTAPSGATTTAVSSGQEPPAQDKITIGAARPISGVNAIFEQAHFGPAYHLWVEELNAAGGLEVAGKKLPIELKIYDDQSDLDTSLRLLTKLMEEDKVDFVFLPVQHGVPVRGRRLDQRAQLHRHERRGWGHHPRARDEEPALDLPVPELLEPLSDAGVRRHPPGSRREDLLHHLPRRPARYRVQLAGPGLPGPSRCQGPEQHPGPGRRQGRLQHHQEDPGREPGRRLLLPVSR